MQSFRSAFLAVMGRVALRKLEWSARQGGRNSSVQQLQNLTHELTLVQVEC